MLRAASAPSLAAGRPATRSQTKAACTQLPPAGMSMSGLLQVRSETASECRKATPGAMPPSPMPDIDSLDLSNPLAVADYVNDVFRYAQIFYTPPPPPVPHTQSF